MIGPILARRGHSVRSTRIYRLCRPPISSPLLSNSHRKLSQLSSGCSNQFTARLSIISASHTGIEIFSGTSTITTDDNISVASGRQARCQGRFSTYLRTVVIAYSVYVCSKTHQSSSTRGIAKHLASCAPVRNSALKRKRYSTRVTSFACT